MNNIILTKKLLKIKERDCKDCGCVGCGKNPLKDLVEWYNSDRYGWRGFINDILKKDRCIYKERYTPV